MYKSAKVIEYDNFKNKEAEEFEANNFEDFSPEREKYFHDKEIELLTSMSNEDLQELIDTPNLPNQAKIYFSKFLSKDKILSSQNTIKNLNAIN